MSKPEIRNIIIESASKCVTKDSWFYLADFGGALRNLGFDLKSTGHLKLSHFLSEYTDLIELKQDEASEIPVTLGRLVKEPSQVKHNGTVTKPVPLVKPNTRKISGSPKNALFEWAWLGDLTTTLNKFRELALYEQWFYGNKSENEINQYPILFNYLIYTFYRLTQEKGKVLETAEFATFNTGLVDRRYEPIYALFKKSKYKRQKWEFSDFSLRLAIKRVKWNYKTAIPMYFPTRDIMSLLLPLALVDDNQVDIALVTEKTQSGSYLGHTILPLDWAYSNARLVCRPNSDWLIAQNIVQGEAEDE